ncbi:MAG TPA: HAD family hydrolase, partial [Delftia acidovorans]|nr:HAD family hydrolase [Delftia acidovorans]
MRAMQIPEAAPSFAGLGQAGFGAAIFDMDGLLIAA